VIAQAKSTPAETRLRKDFQAFQTAAATLYLFFQLQRGKRFSSIPVAPGHDHCLKKYRSQL